jgi:outer membrane protein TolC
MKKGLVIKTAIAFAMTTTLLSTVAWADSFSDALISAYETNPRIKAQRKVLEANNETAPQAYSGWLPSLNGNFQKGRQRNDNSAQTNGWAYGDTEVLGATLSQPLFSGGETLARIDKAEYDIAAALKIKYRNRKKK